MHVLTRERGWRGRVDGGWGGRGREGGEKAVLRKVRNIHPDCSCVFELGCRGAAPTAPKVHDTPVALEIRRRETWRGVAGAALIGRFDLRTMHVPAAEGRLDMAFCAKQAHHPLTWRALLNDRQHNLAPSQPLFSLHLPVSAISSNTSSRGQVNRRVV